ncbi:DNA damage-inducible protein F [Sinobacterium norvegicum]|uniref:DNA damage-inducible protein F n=1 Tax=Sinobacterium norvegicum TaxID=1641715 RepID=A0ABN8ERU0_9GAMM|nr:MATE family efflux transporter [Sinobacterium norvegicum]CAH0992996.1 DNA damage-inducible protein F [Sinobacterium norvegicum]
MQKKVSYLALWAMAWPMLLSNISVPLLGLVDTAILGHLDSAKYLAAVAMGASVIGFIYWSFNFLRMSTTASTAQAIGRDDQQESELVGFRAAIVGLFIGLILFVFHPPLVDLVVAQMGDNNEVKQLAIEYIGIRIYSAPAVLISYALIGWFIGNKQAKVPLMLVVVTNSINIVLDYTFVIHWNMNSAGAAWATLVAEYSAATLAVLFYLKHSKSPLSKLRLALNKTKLLALLAINRPLFVRTVILLGSFLFFTTQGANQGSDIVATNAIIMNLILTISFAMDGYAHACEAYCGEALGRKDMPMFFLTIRYCLHFCIGTAVLFTVFFISAQTVLISLFTTIAHIQILAAEYWIWLVIAPAISFLTYLFDGVFIAGSDTKAMQNTLIFSAFGVYFPVWYFSQGMGNHGLWLAFSCFTVARFASLYLCYRRNNTQLSWPPLQQ